MDVLGDPALPRERNQRTKRPWVRTVFGGLGAGRSTVRRLIAGIGLLYVMPSVASCGGQSTAEPPAAGPTPVTFVSNGQRLNEMVGRGVALADFNGDGNLDAFVANEVQPTGSDNRVYFGDGHGQFVDSGQRLAGSYAVAQPVVFDIDGNGIRDIIVGRTVWLNDGSGRFVPDTSRFVDADGAAFAQCKLADLNGDGRIDLFAITMTANMATTARVYLNDGTGHFRDAGHTPLPSIAAAVALGDVNGDGSIDAVVSGWRNAGGDPCPNRVLLNDGAGRLTDTGQQLDEGTRHSHSLALGDFDQDGDLDLVLVTQGSPAARLYLNDGSGRFTAGRLLGTSDVEKVVVADFNGDGNLDVFLACIGPDQVWLNNGRGEFTDAGLRLGTEWSWEVAVGDINRDGLPDLFVVNFGVDWTAPPESMLRTRLAEVWLNTSQTRRS
jgi:hypothetical protein